MKGESGAIARRSDPSEQRLGLRKMSYEKMIRWGRLAQTKGGRKESKGGESKEKKARWARVKRQRGEVLRTLYTR